MTVDLEARRAIGHELRVTLTRHRQRQKNAAEVLGLDESAMSRRMSGAIPFTIDELLALARWLDEPVTTFLAGLPHLDSNQEPAGNTPDDDPGGGAAISLLARARNRSFSRPDGLPTQDQRKAA